MLRTRLVYLVAIYHTVSIGIPGQPPIFDKISMFEASLFFEVTSFRWFFAPPTDQGHTLNWNSSIQQDETIWSFKAFFSYWSSWSSSPPTWRIPYFPKMKLMNPVFPGFQEKTTTPFASRLKLDDSECRCMVWGNRQKKIYQSKSKVTFELDFPSYKPLSH